MVRFELRKKSEFWNFTSILKIIWFVLPGKYTEIENYVLYSHIKRFRFILKFHKTCAIRNKGVNRTSISCQTVVAVLFVFFCFALFMEKNPTLLFSNLQLDIFHWIFKWTNSIVGLKICLDYINAGTFVNLCICMYELACECVVLFICFYFFCT